MTSHGRNWFRTLFAIMLFMLAADMAVAGPLRERIAERRAAQAEEELGDTEDGASGASLPAGVQVIRDVAYGRANEQRFDVYLPPQGQRAQHANNAPVILMVHGGGWKRGDKAERAVIENKMPHWTSQGFIFISTNYRLLPGTGPVEQAEDIAHALAAVQRNAASWGGDPSRVILMGHSAGSHLVALLSASPDKALRLGASPWLGSVLLDSAALDVVKIMEERHFPLYDDAFGSDPSYWRRASPYHHLSAGAPPMLAVCSTQRKASCPQAREFAAKAATLGVRAPVLEQDLSHREINLLLGEPGRYTAAVDAFIRSLEVRRP